MLTMPNKNGLSIINGCLDDARKDNNRVAEVVAWAINWGREHPEKDAVQCICKATIELVKT